ncbi:YMGG-like glycine zipper-containing protein [Ruegeria sp. Ofav3-42]|uniref:YMGG-like glycine zipper-containing protein n=1 Tax=Ruegeria sp. Ofav3-42 TaxID=2917759 RepID=UPI001EF4A6C2|nr:YMGG-like glycine zipper-containing protein [Ruegeria sp. Ofav3-42]MCG7519460.1 YMGG-like glycine zipper-containing protein [Ruegeria sp. Ofav3-42]
MTISRIGFRTLTFAAAATVAMASAGMADDKKKENTIKGAVVGAGVGALIGDGKGAAIGGVAGAIIGHNWK